MRACFSNSFCFFCAGVNFVFFPPVVGRGTGGRGCINFNTLSRGGTFVPRRAFLNFFRSFPPVVGLGGGGGGTIAVLFRAVIFVRAIGTYSIYFLRVKLNENTILHSLNGLHRNGFT